MSSGESSTPVLGPPIASRSTDTDHHEPSSSSSASVPFSINPSPPPPGEESTSVEMSAMNVEKPHEVNENPQESTPEEQLTSALLNLPPPPPFDLIARDLSIAVPHRKSFKVPSFMKRTEKVEEHVQKRWILDAVECECRSGQVLAILGGSGSGKTTLLNAVAHRLSLPIETGEIAYHSSNRRRSLTNSTPRKLSKNEAKRRIGFVRQQDYLVECLTVRETLTYAARLRLPTDLSSEAITEIVEQTIDELGLRDAADTVVGGPLRKGISGGEKRRLSIGCVLVTLPSVLILDEPTSGLDAFTSYLLLLTLSQLARRGRTVILSIHAPRSDAFPLFDRITLLSKGQVVYSGLGRDCLGWFHSLGHDVQRGVNPLDFLIDVSSVDNRTADNEETSRARVNALVQAWRSRSVMDADNLSLKKSIDEEEIPVGPETPADPPAQLERHTSQAISLQTESLDADYRRPGFFKQILTLTSRAHRNVYRNWPVILGLLGQGIILGFIIGMSYYQLPEDPTGIQSLKNLSFQLVPGVFYLQQVFWIYKYCNDLIIFDREREDHLYDVVPYIISEWISFLMPSILSPTLYVILVYFIAGLRKEDIVGRLFATIGSTVLVQFCVQGLSLISASLVKNFTAASQIGNFLNLFQTMSGGFIVTNVPNYVWWVRWVSPSFYSFRIVAPLQFKDRIFACPAGSTGNLAQCEGNNALNGLGIDPNMNLGVYYGGMIGFALVEYAIACLILWLNFSGGVKHASEIESQNRGKQTDVLDSHIKRQRIDVSVRNLTFKWTRQGRGLIPSVSKVILDDITLDFKAGEVSAILGPSGAGKSTLLQLLANRSLPPGPLATFRRHGDILLANAPVTQSTQTHVAFVEQEDDWHLPSLTVRETLRYAAILRLPDDMPRQQKIARAETVLLMLGLKDCADLPVGGPLLKGISGGEKRRLSLAVQMINDPAVLLVDEPTSGLDSSIALSVMQVLRDIASTGRTVIATIHQPRSDIWQLADNVTLLAKGGVVAYTGKRSDAVDYFTSIGHPMPSEFFNPADHLLDLVSIDPRATSHDRSVSRVKRLTDGWRRKNHVDVGGEIDPGAEEEKKKGESGGRLRVRSMKVALPVVIERMWRNLWRQKEVFFSRLVQVPLLGCMFILFFQRLTHGPSAAQDYIGITIESTAATCFVGLLNAMSIYPSDRNLFFHEAISAARYSSATFLIAYTLIEFWAELLASFGYAAIMNVAVGLPTSAKIFFEYTITIWAMVNMGESVSIIFGAWIAIEGLTVTIVSTILSIAGQISGIMSLSVANWLAGIAWISCIKPAVRVQVINAFQGVTFDCSEKDVTTGTCVAQNGEQVLALFNFSNMDTRIYMAIIVCVAIAWRLAAWLALALRVGEFK